jgi:hypothetical protein
MGESELIKEPSKEPLVTYLEGDKVRVFHFRTFGGVSDLNFMIFYRNDGTVIRIQKQFVIKIEGLGDGINAI